MTLTQNDLDELRAENSQQYADHGAAHSCVFDDEVDDTIPAGSGCGGCACHLSAPCRHCTLHLAEDESLFIRTMINVQGKGTR